MKISQEEYKKAEDCLKRYNYNCITIINVRADIMSIGISANDGMPKAPYSISDSVYNQYVKLQEDKELQKALKEYKVVVQAIQLLNKDCEYIFENQYRKQKNKWEVIDGLGVSEETYKRRKRKLIYAVNEEFKKLTQN